MEIKMFFFKTGAGLLLLIILMVISKFSFAENNDNSKKTRQDINNVLVLQDFSFGNFIKYDKRHEMYRSQGMFVKQIFQHLSNGEELPPPPQPSSKTVTSNSRSFLLPKTAARQSRFEVFPVAWSVKVVNPMSSFPPQLREEAIVLVHYNPQYFSNDFFRDGTWVLACLRNDSHPFSSRLDSKQSSSSDTISCWKIASSPEFANAKNPRSSFLQYKSNIMKFKTKPTLDQVSDFVKTTDFGNNNIYPHTSLADLMDVRVIQVIVYPKYSDCAGLFKDGLSQETIARRKTAYSESIRRSEIIIPSPRNE